VTIVVDTEEELNSVPPVTAPRSIEDLSELDKERIRRSIAMGTDPEFVCDVFRIEKSWLPAIIAGGPEN
jgi:hypothetical protein